MVQSEPAELNAVFLLDTQSAAHALQHQGAESCLTGLLRLALFMASLLILSRLFLTSSSTDYGQSAGMRRWWQRGEAREFWVLDAGNEEFSSNETPNKLKEPLLKTEKCPEAFDQNADRNLDKKNLKS